VVAVARNATKEVKDGVSWVPGDVTVPETLDEVRRVHVRILSGPDPGSIDITTP
jgi:hypothetical protein